MALLIVAYFINRLFSVPSAIGEAQIQESGEKYKSRKCKWLRER